MSPCLVAIRCLTVFAISLLLASSAASQDPVPDVHVVLFTAYGLTPPPDAASTIRDAAKYTETFLVEGLEKHGYPPARKQLFPRDEKGEIKILEITGNEGPDFEGYKDSGVILKEVWPKANEKYNLKKNLPIWWVWVYLGDPPTRYSDYRGFGNLRRGGWAVVNFENRPGDLMLDADMAAGVNEEHTLKGCIHEFGHALGLPHIGPRVKDRAGMTLMGPRTVVFRSKTKNKEDRVYLSDAEAAILSRHFIFTGTTKDRNVVPEVTVSNFTARFDRQKKDLRVRGQLKSNYRAHTAIVFDLAEPDHLDYWRKAYVGRIDDEGQFEVNVDEPVGTTGTLKVLFCFENGVATGADKSSEIEDAFGRKYKFEGMKFSLVD